MWANANLVEMQHGPFNNKSDYYVRKLLVVDQRHKTDNG
jgi:hypothetical protein